MSSAPTGSVVPSIAAILAASRWARVTPRVRSPTKVTSLAPPLRSRISWAMRVSARSRAEVSSTSAFSRKRDEREVIILSLRASQGPLKGKHWFESSHSTRPLALLSTRGGDEQRHELVEVHRLGEMRVEPGLERLAHVLGLAVAGQRDQPRDGQIGACADAPRDLEAVDVRQADVAEHDVRTEPLGDPQPFLAAFRGLHRGAFHLEHELEDVAR